jgi:hypothetical protein
VRGGHDDALEPLGTHGVGGDLGDEGGVDSTREADDDVGEAVLAHVVANAEGEGRVDLGVLAEAVGEGAGRDLGAGGERHVADEHPRFELRRAGDRLAVGGDDDALAVEDQLVLAAHGVAEGERDPVGAGSLGQHRLPGGCLAAGVGRARRVDDQPRTRGGLVGLGRARDPDVLADRQADRDARDIDHQRLGARLEVAALVEDGVVREMALAVDGRDPAAGADRERVVGGRGNRVDDRVARAVLGAVDAFREADEGGDALGLGCDVPERLADRLEEVGAQHQVLGRVAREAQLRQDHELGSGLAGARDRLGGEARVAVDVADGRVDLGECQAQCVGLRHGPSMAAPTATLRRREVPARR